MITFPNCKINLGLNILAKRPDGYHDIETVFFPLPFTDALEIVESPHPGIELEVTGAVTGLVNDNLCYKAYALINNDFQGLPGIKMHLHKAVPIGAGLGGGSADGAFTLQLLDKKFNFGITKERLLQYALELGSDCPFFIVNQPCFASGRGEILDPIKLDLSGYQVVIVNPGIHINTGWAFSLIKPGVPKKSLSTVIQQPVITWKDEMVNDFEDMVAGHYPVIKEIIDRLYQLGAKYACMTGTGSTVFALLKKKAPLESPFPKHYFYKVLTLS